MPDEKRTVFWEVAGDSVRGATHVRNNKPNQDFLDWNPKIRTAAPVSLAVSDGHGSAKSFRSDTGSKYAAEVALDVLREFFAAKRGEKPPSPRFSETSVMRDSAQDKLPRELVRRWIEKVEQHLKQNPFLATELDPLGAAENEVHKNPLLAYGATLLVVLIADTYILYAQLGDGDILTVSEAGQIGRPIAPDKRLFANETTSLCAPQAWNDFRVTVQQVGESEPAVILVSTDGYANSFRDDTSFEKVGLDIYQLINQDGWETVKASLNGWLNEASEKGSGDDISLGILWRSDGPEDHRDFVAKTTRVAPDASPTGGLSAMRGATEFTLKKKLQLFRDKYDEQTLDDPRRINAILLDLFERNQRDMLLAAHRSDVIAHLRHFQEREIQDRLIGIAKQLQKTSQLSDGAAYWAVEVWAAALGIIPVTRPADQPQHLTFEPSPDNDPSKRHWWDRFL